MLNCRQILIFRDGTPQLYNFMKKALPACFVLAFSLFYGQAQKKVLGYPFQFEKSFLAKGNYNALFLDNPDDSAFALVLIDNKKVEYVWLSKAFKVIGKVSAPIGNTILDQNMHRYMGGTAKGSVYHFIYKLKSGYDMETVDFNGQVVSNKKILELPDNEHLLASFSDHNVYYSIAADDKAGQAVLHIVNADGELSQQNLAFPIPENADKHKISEYLAGLKVIKSGEDPELSVAVNGTKLFSRPGDLSIVVNKADMPTQIFSIKLGNFATRDQHIDYGSLIAKEDRGKVYISSFLKDSVLYSLMLNKKSIRIAIHALPEGRLLNKFEFTDDAGFDLLAETPITEKRIGKQVEAKDVDELKKVIRVFTKGTEGLMVAQMESGKLVLTAGTYDMVKVSSGASGAHMPDMPEIHMEPEGAAGMVPFWITRPGAPIYTTPSARYYTTTYFRMLLDPVTFKVTRGQVRRPVADQIKDYVDDTDMRSKAKNQFAIGKNQYYGFYDRDAEQYVVEQIRIF